MTTRGGVCSTVGFEPKVKRLLQKDKRGRDGASVGFEPSYPVRHSITRNPRLTLPTATAAPRSIKYWNRKTSLLTAAARRPHGHLYISPNEVSPPETLVIAHETLDCVRRPRCPLWNMPPIPLSPNSSCHPSSAYCEYSVSLA